VVGLAKAFGSPATSRFLFPVLPSLPAKHDNVVSFALFIYSGLRAGKMGGGEEEGNADAFSVLLLLW